MNEEQGDELIEVLKEIRDYLKPKEPEKDRADIILARLKKGFYDSLNDTQKKYIDKIDEPLILSYNFMIRRNKKNEWQQYHNWQR